MKILEWYKEAAQWTNEKKVDTHIHILIGVLVQVIFMKFGLWHLGILTALIIGGVKELIDKSFNIKDMLDYLFGALLICIGSLL